MGWRDPTVLLAVDGLRVDETSFAPRFLDLPVPLSLRDVAEKEISAGLFELRVYLQRPEFNHVRHTSSVVSASFLLPIHLDVKRSCFCYYFLYV
mgnify:CR=1 FL=1